MSISRFNRAFTKWLTTAPKCLDKKLLREAFIAERFKNTRGRAGSGTPARRAASKRFAREVRSRMRLVGPKLPPGLRRQRVNRPDILLYRYPPDLIRGARSQGVQPRWTKIRMFETLSNTPHLKTDRMAEKLVRCGSK